MAAVRRRQDTVREAEQVTAQVLHSLTGVASARKSSCSCLSQMSSVRTIAVSAHGPVQSLRYSTRSHVRQVIRDQDQDPDAVAGMSGPSDLVPGQYEGGFKVWESTSDLTHWVNEHADQVRGKEILDLGCGAGLVGIGCLIAGASRVTFHDFNPAVIEFFTKVNLSMNSSEEGDKSLISRSDFASGDWSQFQPQQQFDLIFSSETVYEQKNYASLLSLITRSLKPEGKTLIAGKTYYFGVGGGTRSFAQFVADNERLEVESVTLIQASVQREILQLQHTPDSHALIE